VVSVPRSLHQSVILGYRTVALQGLYFVLTSCRMLKTVDRVALLAVLMRSVLLDNVSLSLSLQVLFATLGLRTVVPSGFHCV